MTNDEIRITNGVKIYNVQFTISNGEIQMTNSVDLPSFVISN